MSMLASLGTAALSALPQIAQAVIPTIVSGVANQVINGSLSGGSSSGQQTGSSMSQTVQQGSSSSSVSGQQGSVQGIANLMGTALGTATGNNATSAATFNQQSAQTANDIQGKMFNNANMLNLLSNVVGNLANAASQSSAKRFSSEEAKIAREFQKDMRGTAYQDTMKDMMKAGLNPILAASNGATNTPGTSSASIGAQHYNQASSAGVPAAHTASMAAMYDYGNNTAQFIQNATAAINTAKQFGYQQVASSMEQSLGQIASSSAKTINRYAQDTESTSTSSSTSRTEKDFIPGHND